MKDEVTTHIQYCHESTKHLFVLRYLATKCLNGERDEFVLATSDIPLLEDETLQILQKLRRSGHIELPEIAVELKYTREVLFMDDNDVEHGIHKLISVQLRQKDKIIRDYRDELRKLEKKISHQYDFSPLERQVLLVKESMQNRQQLLTKSRFSFSFSDLDKKSIRSINLPFILLYMEEERIISLSVSPMSYSLINEESNYDVKYLVDFRMPVYDGNWFKIDFNKGLVTYKDDKNIDDKVIPFNSTAYKLLNTFVQRDGKKISHGEVATQVKECRTVNDSIDEAQNASDALKEAREQLKISADGTDDVFRNREGFLALRKSQPIKK